MLRRFYYVNPIPYLICLFSILELSTNQVAPTWLPSSKAQAGSLNIITTKTDYLTTPKAVTATFLAAFSAVPKIAVGIQNYQPLDSLNLQCFQVNRTGLTTSSVTFKLFTLNGTNLWFVTARYLAIDSTLTHPINVFDNVPANYGGTLSNVTVKGTSYNTYVNTVNFTTQSTAAGYSSYKNFSGSLTDHKIIYFISTFDQVGTQQTTLFFTTSINPIKLLIQMTIVSSTTYKINVTYGIKAQLNRIRFSLIIYNQYSIKLSNTFDIVSTKFTYTYMGGFTSLPQTFVNSCMVGMVELTSNRTFAAIMFHIYFQNQSSVFGAYMPRISLISGTNTGDSIDTVSFNLLYFKQYLCPSGKLYNSTTSMCETCTIPNCLTCLNLITCQVCDTANGYSLNPTAIPSQQCMHCFASNCLQCSTTNTSQCNQCDYFNNYVLSSNVCVLCTIPHCINCSSVTTCTTCDQTNHYFYNPSYTSTSDICILCSISNCNICANLTNCSECNTASSYSLNPYPTSTSDQCILCTLSNCLQCLDSTSCYLCNQPNNYFLNNTDVLCHLCTIPNCIECSSLSTCLTCDHAMNYFINTAFTSTNDYCILCTLSNCILCLNLTACINCDEANGYFLNLTSYLCQPCSIPNCQICRNQQTCQTCDPTFMVNPSPSSLTDICISCPIPNCQICLNASTCQTCSSVTNYILNPTPTSISNQCILCTLSNCIQCINSTHCRICDQANRYFLNTTTSRCALCSITNCMTCGSLSTCVACRVGYILNAAPTSTSNICIPCPIPNCFDCLNSTNCSACNSAGNYSLNPYPTSTSDQCILCNLIGCLQCLDTTSCFICDQANNYLLNATDQLCYLCGIDNCKNCSSQTSCTTCIDTYFINTSPTGISDICIFCPIPNCITCTSLTNCGICNSSANYVLNPTPTSTSDQCILCSLAHCLQCLNAAQCQTCDVINNFFLSSSDKLCYECTILNCLVCSSLSICQTCDQANNYFVNPAPTANSNICKLCTPTNCQTCQSLTQCQTCSPTYSLDPNTKQCFLCTVPNCLQCQTATTCKKCDSANSYFLNPTTLQCFQSLIVVCGNNIWESSVEGCDDGNLEAGDGCSEVCGVEDKYSCEANPDISLLNSVCYYQGEITMKILYIQKTDNMNQIQIKIQIGPKGAKFWDSVDFASMASLSNMTGFDNYSVVKNSDGTISIMANYNIDIHGMNITVQLDPSKSGNIQLSRKPPLSKSFQAIPQDNQSAYLYDQGTYSLANLISLLALAVGIMSLLVFLLAIFGAKVVGVQMMGVIQITYLSLVALDSMNPCFNALSNIWFVNGINHLHFGASKTYLVDPNTPIQAKGISLYSLFVQNFNLTFIILILTPYLAALICLILTLTVYKSKMKKKAYLQNLARRLSCQYVFNGLIFSAYIVFVSMILQFQFGIKRSAQAIGGFSMFQAVVLLLMFLVYSVLIIRYPHQFGQFTQLFVLKDIQAIRTKTLQAQKLKQSQNTTNRTLNNSLTLPQPQPQASQPVNFHMPALIEQANKKWYNIIIIQRFLVSVFLILMIQVPMQLIINVILFTLFGIYVLLARPYNKLMHNVRFVCNMGICVVIQGFYLGYRNSKAAQQLSKSQLTKSGIWIYAPIIVCVLLLACVIYSAVILIYQLVLNYKQNKGKNSQQQHSQLADLNFLKQSLPISMSTALDPCQIKAFKNSIIKDQNFQQNMLEYEQARQCALKKLKDYKQELINSKLSGVEAEDKVPEFFGYDQYEEI